MLRALRRLRLVTQPPFNGAGTFSNPYKIDNATQLNQLRIYVNTSIAPYSNAGIYYEQTKAIDLAGYANWTPIGSLALSKAFSGIYNGQGYAISNLTTSGTGTRGLFGMTIAATLQNIVISSGTVAASGDGGWAAGIVAYAINTSISGCSNSASITCTTSTSSGLVGGICGYFERGSGALYILDCANYGAINANMTTTNSTKYGAGIVAYIAGTVSYVLTGRLFNSGAVTRSASATINAVANNGNLVSCYRDSDTSSAAGGTGITDRATANCTGSTALGTGKCTLLGTLNWKTTVGYPVPINTK